MLLVGAAGMTSKLSGCTRRGLISISDKIGQTNRGKHCRKDCGTDWGELQHEQLLGDWLD